jgi:hypothetical protein
MKATMALLTVALVTLGGVGAGPAMDVKEHVKVDVESVGLHPGMDPGMYVCASGHLHIRGTVHNLTDSALGPITVAGQAFDAEGTLLGTATASTQQARLAPREKAEINLEFLTVTGPLIQQVKQHEVTVTEAPPVQ